MIPSFPKIFAIGTRHVQNIFDDEVEISEKIDGSQFCFGKINGTVYVRSKGAQLYFDNPEKMFLIAIDYIQSIQERLPEGIIFYVEYLNKPKHNTLKYNRVPKNNLILFGIMSDTMVFDEDLSYSADLLDIETVPIIYKGKVGNAEYLKSMLERESVLGGCKVEGIVVKNYNRPFIINGMDVPIMSGKYVSEAFKEVHQNRRGTEEKGKNKLETFFESFRTEARWGKAIQHLRERGELENAPSDIGKLIKEVQSDIEEEEKENIKDFLWKEFNGQLKRKASAGVAEWYKNRLLNNSF